MRKYDIPYVKNGPANYYPATPLQDMSLEDIKKKYIKTCAKANGNVSECSKCKTPCPEGKRAIQLIANSIYNDPPIPLYGGKTLIERAKEENMKRKQELEEKEKPQATISRKTKDGRIYIDNWYEKAMSTDDPVAWIMDAFHTNRRNAKHKIYVWQYQHRKLKNEDSVKEPAESVPNAVETKPEENIEQIQKPLISSPIETKLEHLMKLQDEQKKVMAEYQQLYEEAKKEYERIKQKTDILCSAMDILNDP